MLDELDNLEEQLLTELAAEVEVVVPQPLLLCMSVQQREQHLCPEGDRLPPGTAVEAFWGHFDKDPLAPERAWRGAVLCASEDGLYTVLYDDATAEHDKPSHRVHKAHGETKASRFLAGDLEPGSQLEVKLRKQYLLTLSRVRALRAACELTRMTAVSACAPVSLGHDGLGTWPLCGMPGGAGKRLWVVERDWSEAASQAASVQEREAAEKLLLCVRDAAWRERLLACASTMAQACTLVVAALRPALVELVLGAIVDERWRVQAIEAGDAPDVQLFVEALCGVRRAITVHRSAPNAQCMYPPHHQVALTCI